MGQALKYKSSKVESRGITSPLTRSRSIHSSYPWDWVFIHSAVKIGQGGMEADQAWKD